jgi:hypothetical protein
MNPTHKALEGVSKGLRAATWALEHELNTIDTRDLPTPVIAKRSQRPQ